MDAIDLGRLVGYLNPSHVTHQRLLLHFLSAPEDGRKKRPKHVEQYSCGCHRPWTPCWIPQPVSCHSPEAASTVSKYSWRWTQKASDTCRAILQLQINILPSCITLVLLYILTYDARKHTHKILFLYCMFHIDLLINPVPHSTHVRKLTRTVVLKFEIYTDFQIFTSVAVW